MRIETTTRELYKFEELNEKAKERARDKYREDIDFSFEAECVTDDAIYQLKLLGFDIEHVYWRGFASQGDGACFVGSWHAKDFKGGSEGFPGLEEEFAAIAKEFPEARATIKKRSFHYEHEQTVSIECEEGFEIERDDGPVWSTTDAGNFEDFTRECMQQIYQQLERQWEWINEDEQVDEALIANGYEFTKEGRMI
jgi:hypothetical protein